MNGTLEIQFPKRRNMKHYFNTVGEDQEQSKVYDETAKIQDNAVYQIMKTYDRGEGWTSSELHERFGGQILETSIRRALTNNMKAGKVRQTGERRKGGHGRSCLVWRVS